MDKEEISVLNKVFAAAICRDLVEGGDGKKYFGSLGGWTVHKQNAMTLGWLNSRGKLTDVGKELGERCREINDGRAYFFKDEYADEISGLSKH